MGKPTHKRVAKPSDEPSTPPTPLNAKSNSCPDLLDQAPASTAPAPNTLELPLHHFLSKVSLQLLGIVFILSSAASNANGNTSLAPTQLFRSLITALVQQPGKTLSTTCTGVAVIQIWYGLWAQGLRKAHAAGPVAAPTGEQAPKKGFTGALKEMAADAKRGKAPQLQNMQTTKGKAPFSFDLNYLGIAGLMTTAAAVVLHGCAVLLGAPLFSKVKETFLLSFLVAQLALAPIALAVPYTERYVWLRLFSSISPANDLELALLAPAFGTIIGTWLGAVPIPLDWDRPWQAWPTTCVIGAVLGHFVGTAVGVVLVSRNAAKGKVEGGEAEETKKDK